MKKKTAIKKAKKVSKVKGPTEEELIAASKTSLPDDNPPAKGD